MKAKEPSDVGKPDVIQKIADLVTLQGPIRRMERWIDYKLKNYTFELTDGVIVSGRGSRPHQRIAVKEIRAWQEIWIGGGVPFICIEVEDGTRVDWADKYGCLFAILQKVAGDKELPFAYI
jgi:hypothetical protein